MLHLAVYVQVDAADLVPEPQPVFGEFDGVTMPMGIERYQSERINDYKTFAYEMSRIGFLEREQHAILASKEARIEGVPMLLECVNTSTSFMKAKVTSNNKLQIYTYANATSSPYYTSTSYEYDLLDRSSFPFLNDVCASATKEIAEARFHLDEGGHGHFSNIAPYNLLPVQTNFSIESYPALKSTSYKLGNRFIIPDTFRVFSDEVGTDMVLNQVGESTAVTNAGDYYIDYVNGKVTTGTDFGKYNIRFQYQHANYKTWFQVSPGFSVFSLGDKNILSRYHQSVDENYSTQAVTYYQNSTTVGTGDTYVHLQFCKEISDLATDLQQSNKMRWN